MAYEYDDYEYDDPEDSYEEPSYDDTEYDQPTDEGDGEDPGFYYDGYDTGEDTSDPGFYRGEADQPSEEDGYARLLGGDDYGDRREDYRGLPPDSSAMEPIGAGEDVFYDKGTEQAPQGAKPDPLEVLFGRAPRQSAEARPQARPLASWEWDPSTDPDVIAARATRIKTPSAPGTPDGQDAAPSPGQPAAPAQDATAITLTAWADGTPMSEKDKRQARVYQIFREEGLDAEAARAAVAETEQEGGLFGAVNTQDPHGGSHGPWQLNGGGELLNFIPWVSKQLGRPVSFQEATELAKDIDLSSHFAAQTYQGRVLREGQARGIHGAALAEYAQRNGQVSVTPEVAGQNYQRMFANGDPYDAALAKAKTGKQQPAAAARATPATPYATQQMDKNGNIWTVAFDVNAKYDHPFNAAIPNHRGVDLIINDATAKQMGLGHNGEGYVYTPFRSGKVVYLQNDPNGGLGIIVDTGDPNARYDRYFHNNTALVKVGDTVVQGQTQLGTVGHTGTEGFPHLHYEVAQNMNGDPMGHIIDPKPYMAPPQQQAQAPITATGTKPAVAQPTGPLGRFMPSKPTTTQVAAQTPPQQQQQGTPLPAPTQAALTEWQAFRKSRGEDPTDTTEFRAHLARIGAPDPWKDVETRNAEIEQQRQAWRASLPKETVNALDVWQAARRQRGEDPNDTAAFRDHLGRIGARDPWKEQEQAQAAAAARAAAPAPPAAAPRPAAPAQPATQQVQVPTYTVGGREVSEGEYRAAVAENERRAAEKAAFDARADAEQGALDRYNQEWQQWQADRDRYAAAGELFDRPQPSRPDTSNLNMRLQGRAPEGQGAATAQYTRVVNQQLGVNAPKDTRQEAISSAIEDEAMIRQNQRGQAASAQIAARNDYDRQVATLEAMRQADFQQGSLPDQTPPIYDANNNLAPAPGALDTPPQLGPVAPPAPAELRPDERPGWVRGLHDVPVLGTAAQQIWDQSQGVQSGELPPNPHLSDAPTVVRYQNETRAATVGLASSLDSYANGALTAAGLGESQVAQWFQRSRDHFDELQRQDPRYQSTEIDYGNPAVYADPLTYASVAGQVTPSVLGAMATGGLLGAAMTGVGIAAEAPLVGALPALGSRAAWLGSAAFTLPTAAGTTYEALVKLGASPQQAFVGANISGALQSALEVISPVDGLGAVERMLAAKGTGSFTHRLLQASAEILTNAAKEGTEEASQEAADYAVQKWFGSDKSWKDEWKDLRDNFVIGAISGGGMASPSAAAIMRETPQRATPADPQTIPFHGGTRVLPAGDWNTFILERQDPQNPNIVHDTLLTVGEGGRVSAVPVNDAGNRVAPIMDTPEARWEAVRNFGRVYDALERQGAVDPAMRLAQQESFIRGALTGQETTEQGLAQGARIVEAPTSAPIQHGATGVPKNEVPLPDATEGWQQPVRIPNSPVSVLAPGNANPAYAQEMANDEALRVMANSGSNLERTVTGVLRDAGILLPGRDRPFQVALWGGPMNALHHGTIGKEGGVREADANAISIDPGSMITTARSRANARGIDWRTNPEFADIVNEVHSEAVVHEVMHGLFSGETEGHSQSHFVAIPLIQNAIEAQHEAMAPVFRDLWERGKLQELHVKSLKGWAENGATKHWRDYGRAVYGRIAGTPELRARLLPSRARAYERAVRQQREALGGAEQAGVGGEQQGAVPGVPADGEVGRAGSAVDPGLAGEGVSAAPADLGPPGRVDAAPAEHPGLAAARARAEQRGIGRIRNEANEYVRAAGIRNRVPPSIYVRNNRPVQERIAAAYEQATNDPSDPETQRAYAQLAKEVDAQFKFLTDRGVTFVPYYDNQPAGDGADFHGYANSAAMIQDLADNNRLYVYADYNEHPLLSPPGTHYSDSSNWKFRAVHDYFGHAAQGFEFGPRGEESAWLEHVKMFSPLAARAMTTETRGQNSWANFRPGMEGVPLQDRGFAEQKAFLLPGWALTNPEAYPGEHQNRVATAANTATGADGSIGLPIQGTRQEAEYAAALLGQRQGLPEAVVAHLTPDGNTLTTTMQVDDPDVAAILASTFRSDPAWHTSSVELPDGRVEVFAVGRDVHPEQAMETVLRVAEHMDANGYGVVPNFAMADAVTFRQEDYDAVIARGAGTPEQGSAPDLGPPGQSGRVGTGTGSPGTNTSGPGSDAIEQGGRPAANLPSLQRGARGGVIPIEQIRAQRAAAAQGASPSMDLPPPVDIGPPAIVEQVGQRPRPPFPSEIAPPNEAIVPRGSSAVIDPERGLVLRVATEPPPMTNEEALAEGWGGIPRPRPYGPADPIDGAADLRNRLALTPFISQAELVQMLGSRPQDLEAVIDFMMAQRQKVQEGRLEPADLAKAYLMTVSSQGQGAIRPSIVEEKTGMRIPEHFLTVARDGTYRIRPEDAAAAWLASPNGQRALAQINRGVYNEDLWREAADVRAAFSDDRVANLGLLGRQPGQPATRKLSMRSIPALTAELNRSGGDPRAVADTVGRLAGIGPRKSGFIQHLLGFGELPTLDARAINAWITGGVSVRGRTDEQAQIARAVNEHLGAKGGRGMSVSGALVMARILTGYNRLRRSGFAADIPRPVYNAVIHAWLWAKLGGIERTNAPIYGVQRARVEDPDRPSYLPKGAPTRVSNYRVVDGRLTYTRGGLGYAMPDPNENALEERPPTFQDAPLVDPNAMSTPATSFWRDTFEQDNRALESMIRDPYEEEDARRAAREQGTGPSPMISENVARLLPVSPRRDWPANIQEIMDGTSSDGGQTKPYLLPDGGITFPQATRAQDARIAGQSNPRTLNYYSLHPEYGGDYATGGTSKNRVGVSGVGMPMKVRAPHTFRNPYVYYGGAWAEDHARQLSQIMGEPGWGEMVFDEIKEDLATNGPRASVIEGLLRRLGGNPAMTGTIHRAMDGQLGDIEKGGMADMILTQILAEETRKQGYDGIITWRDYNPIFNNSPIPPRFTEGFSAVEWTHPDQHGIAQIHPDMLKALPGELRPVWSPDPMRRSRQADRAAAREQAADALAASDIGKRTRGYEVRDGRLVFRDEPTGYRVDGGRLVQDDDYNVGPDGALKSGPAPSPMAAELPRPEDMQTQHAADAIRNRVPPPGGFAGPGELSKLSLEELPNGDILRAAGWVPLDGGYIPRDMVQSAEEGPSAEENDDTEEAPEQNDSQAEQRRQQRWAVWRQLVPNQRIPPGLQNPRMEMFLDELARLRQGIIAGTTPPEVASLGALLALGSVKRSGRSYVKTINALRANLGDERTAELMARTRPDIYPQRAPADQEKGILMRPEILWAMLAGDTTDPVMMRMMVAIARPDSFNTEEERKAAAEAGVRALYNRIGAKNAEGQPIYGRDSTRTAAYPEGRPILPAIHGAGEDLTKILAIPRLRNGVAQAVGSPSWLVTEPARWHELNEAARGMGGLVGPDSPYHGLTGEDFRTTMIERLIARHPSGVGPVKSRFVASMTAFPDYATLDTRMLRDVFGLSPKLVIKNVDEYEYLSNKLWQLGSDSKYLYGQQWLPWEFLTGEQTTYNALIGIYDRVERFLAKAESRAAARGVPIGDVIDEVAGEEQRANVELKDPQVVKEKLVNANIGLAFRTAEVQEDAEGHEALIQGLRPATAGVGQVRKAFPELQNLLDDAGLELTSPLGVGLGGWKDDGDGTYYLDRNFKLALQGSKSATRWFAASMLWILPEERATMLVYRGAGAENRDHVGGLTVTGVSLDDVDEITRSLSDTFEGWTITPKQRASKGVNEKKRGARVWDMEILAAGVTPTDGSKTSQEVLDDLTHRVDAAITAIQGMGYNPKEIARHSFERAEVEFLKREDAEEVIRGGPQGATVVPGASGSGAATTTESGAQGAGETGVSGEPGEVGLPTAAYRDPLQGTGPSPSVGEVPALPADPFFSGLSRVIDAKMPNRASVQQVRAILRGNAKEDEILWTGLGDLLDEAESDGRMLGKPEVQQFLRDNAVRVEETMLGDAAPGAAPLGQASLQALDRARTKAEAARTAVRDLIQQTMYADEPEFVGRNHADYYSKLLAGVSGNDAALLDEIGTTPREALGMSVRFQGEFQDAAAQNGRDDDADEALIRLETDWTDYNRERRVYDMMVQDAHLPTRWDTYQGGSLVTPGGRNQREILLTLPDPPVTTDDEGFTTYGEGMPERRRGLRYNEPHWQGIPNVVGHIRANDREDVDGNRLFYLEEVQSQWHQTGRDKGYRANNDDIEQARAAVDESRQELWQAFGLTEAREGTDEPYWMDKEGLIIEPVLVEESSDGLYNVIYVRPEDGQRVIADYRVPMDSIIDTYNVPGRHRMATPDELQAIADFQDRELRRKDLESSLGSNRLPPQAPFSKSWETLLMRRAIRWAAEHGYDRIAWTPGDIHNDRYNLSKHLDAVWYAPASEENPSGRLLGLKGGSLVVQQDDVAPEDLAGMIGKDVAERLLATEPEQSGWGQIHVLEGQDLTMGGDAMRTFYDRKLPNVANQIGKPFGARVTPTTIPGATSADPGWRVVADDGRELGTFDTQIEADSFAGFMGGSVERESGQTEPQEVWSLPITDELRQSAVEQGFPMFMAGEVPDVPLPDPSPDPFYSRLTRAAEGLPPRFDAIPERADERVVPARIAQAAAKVQGRTPPSDSGLIVDADGNWVVPERRVTGKPKPARPVSEQVLSLLRERGVKDGEIAWSGLKDWLEQQDGPVTREQIVGYLDQHQIQLDEVEHSDAPPEPTLHWSQRRDGRWEGSLGYQVWPREEDQDFVLTGESLSGMEVLGTFPTLEEAQRAAVVDARDDPALSMAPMRPTRYRNYTLPGGENYRELLMTLPRPLNRTGWTAKQVATSTSRSYPTPIWDIYGPDGQIRAASILARTAEEAIGKSRDEVAGGDYRSTHWSTPNVLVHVRFNERTAADGKPMLFIEEIQSDWHQEGRKKGYIHNEPAYVWMDRERGIPSPPYPTREAAEAQLSNLDPDARDRQQLLETSRVVGTVPEAPFRNTEQWSALAFRRMLRWAAEHGFDRVGWTTGEQQNERYNLNNDVRTLSYNPDTQVLRAYFRNHEGGPREFENVGPDDLSDYMQDEIAQRLLTRPRNAEGAHALSGLKDFKLEGKGMKGFYDKILVNTANQIGKPFGTQVGTTPLEVAETAGQNERLGLMHEVFDPDGEVYDAFPTREQALAAAQDAGEGYTVKSPDVLRTQSVHAMDLPREMKASVLQGQPMFSAAEVPPLPEFDDGIDPLAHVDPEWLEAMDEYSALQEIEDPDAPPRTSDPSQVRALIPPSGPALGPVDPERQDYEQFPDWAGGLITMGEVWQKPPEVPDSVIADTERAITEGPNAATLSASEMVALRGAIMIQHARLIRETRLAAEKGKDSDAWDNTKVIEQSRRYTALMGLATIPREQWGTLEAIWKSAPISEGQGDTLEDFLAEQRKMQAQGTPQAVAQAREMGIKRAAKLVAGDRPRMRRYGSAQQREEVVRAGQALAAAATTQGMTPRRLADTVAQPEDLSFSPTEFILAMRYQAMLLGPRGILVDYLSNGGQLAVKAFMDPFLPSTGGKNLRARGAIYRAELAGMTHATPLAMKRVTDLVLHGMADLQSEAAGTPKAIAGRLGRRIENRQDELGLTDRMGIGPERLGLDIPVDEQGRAWRNLDPELNLLRLTKASTIGLAELAGRLKGVADAGISTLAFGMEQSRQAGIMAWKEGVDPASPEFGKRVAEILEGVNLHPDAEQARVIRDTMWANSRREAERTVYQGQMGFIGTKMEVIQKHPIGSFILPFLRALYHIRGWAIDLSPAGLVATGADVARSYIPTDAPGMQYSGMAAGALSGAALGGTIGGPIGVVVGGAAGAYVGRGGNLAGGPYRESFSNPIPGPVARLELRLAANAIGTAGFFWLLGKALEGGLSGSGPPDDPIPLIDPAPPDFAATGLRKTMEAQGWQRYSIKIGDRWYSYANWGPLAYLMASAAAVGESYRYGLPAEKKHATGTVGRLRELWDQGDAGLARSATRRAFGVMKETSYLGGLMETVNLVDNLYELGIRGGPEGETPSEKIKRERRLWQEVGDYGTSIATTLIPVSALANSIAGAQDPKQRASQFGDLSDAVAQRVPEQGPVPDLGPPGDFIPDTFGKDELGSPTGRRQGLPARVDVLGRPMENEQTGILGALNPIRSRREDLSSPTLNAMVEAGVGIPTAPSELIYRPLSGKADEKGRIDPKSRQRDLKIVQITPRIQMQLQETIGQRVDARVQELLNEVPEEARKADPDGWRQRLIDETSQIYKTTTREYSEDPVNSVLTLEPLMKDSGRVRPFEPKPKTDVGESPDNAPPDIGPPEATPTPEPGTFVPPMATPSPTPKKATATPSTKGTSTPKGQPTPAPTPRAPAAPAAPPQGETPEQRQRRLIRERNGLAP